MLRTLKFKTSVSDFVGEFDEAFLLKGFKDFNEVAPLLSPSQREILYNHWLSSDVMPFIPAFNLLKTNTVNLPYQTYGFLEEITIDELNLIRILEMLKKGFFPRLKNLSIESRSFFSLNFSEGMYVNLRKISFQNLGTRLVQLQDLSNLHLDELDLLAYQITFSGSLPRKIRLEQCAVALCAVARCVCSTSESECSTERYSMEQCEELTLISTKWQDFLPPSKRLLIQKCSIRIPYLPPTLTELSFVDSEIQCTMLERIENLKLIGGTIDLKISQNSPLKELTVGDSIAQSLVMLPTIERLTIVGNGLPHSFAGIKSLTLVKAEVAIQNLLDSLPETMKELKMIRCITIGETFIVRKLTSLNLYKCLIIQEVIHNPHLTSLIRSLTDLREMTLDEFEFLCISKSLATKFDDYWEYFHDLNEMKCISEADNSYEEIFERYSYTIEIGLIPEKLRTPILKHLLLKGHDKTVIIIGNVSYRVSDFRESQARFIKGDVNMNDFDREMMKIFRTIS